MKFLMDSRVTKIGSLVADFVEQEKMLILFFENAPEELHEMALLHRITPLRGEIQAGDRFLLGNHGYRVISVGDQANETLRELGHCTIKFTGKPAPELPGMVEVEAKSVGGIDVDVPLCFVRDAGSY